MKVLLLAIFMVFSSANVYILDSKVNIQRYMKLGLDIYNYQDNLKLLQKKTNGKIISEDDITNLPKNSTLFLIDDLALSQKAQKDIIDFVANGGVIVFNFKPAYIDENDKYTKNKFLSTITGLKPAGYIKKGKDNVYFLVQNLLSPIAIKDAKRIDFVVYDNIPIFRGKKPDLEFTNFAMTQPIIYKNRFLPNGAFWSGKYKKGGWIYFNLPFYMFLNDGVEKKYFDSLLNSIINYSTQKIAVIKYPFLYLDKMVFISEDTEYEFFNLAQFVGALNKYDLNGTAFCVGHLAKNYPELMKQVGNMKNIEVGSHSYSHTKLIDKPANILKKVEINGNDNLLYSLSHQKTRGFRPPREETNKKLIGVIENSTLNYVLSKNLGQLRAKYEGKILFFPRIGTDDYQYIIELDWTPKQIVDEMKKEVDFLMGLNAMYTLSTHTHLMNYGSNIKMLESLLAYVKKKHYPVYKGKTIARLINEMNNINLNYKKLDKKLIITINNKNKTLIKSFKFRIYFLNDIYSKIEVDNPKISVKIINLTNNYENIEVRNIPPNRQFKVILEK